MKCILSLDSVLYILVLATLSTIRHSANSRLILELPLTIEATVLIPKHFLYSQMNLWVTEKSALQSFKNCDDYCGCSKLEDASQNIKETLKSEQHLQQNDDLSSKRFVCFRSRLCSWSWIRCGPSRDWNWSKPKDVAFLCNVRGLAVTKWLHKGVTLALLMFCLSQGKWEWCLCPVWSLRSPSLLSAELLMAIAERQAGMQRHLIF